MQLTLKRLSSAIAVSLLFACADVGYRTPWVPAAPVASADDAYLVGRSQHMAQRYDQALVSYQAALAAMPGHVNASNGLAALYAERGNVAQAILMWQNMTNEAAADAGSAYLFSNLAYAYFLSGDFKQGLGMLEKACVLDQLNPHVWQHLGDALYKLGQPERAQAMYRQAQALRGHDIKADYAIVKTPTMPATAGAAAAVDGGWAATEILETASGMFVLHTKPGSRPAEASVFPASVQPLRETPALLEVRNGNGVTGMAKRVGRTLNPLDLRVVRLSNQKGFGVARTRIEYQPAFRTAAERLALRFGAARAYPVSKDAGAEIRLIIGRDLVPATSTATMLDEKKKSPAAG